MSDPTPEASTSQVSPQMAEALKLYRQVRDPFLTLHLSLNSVLLLMRFLIRQQKLKDHDTTSENLKKRASPHALRLRVRDQARC